MGFERWTERARQVIVLSQQEARLLRHNYIGTEHLLLGLIREEEGIAARALAALGLNYGAARAGVLDIVSEGEVATGGQIPFTPRAQKACELALREALSLGCNYIGTEHVLLGVTREGEGIASRVLLTFDADSEKVRNEVIRRLGSSRTAERVVPTQEQALRDAAHHLAKAQEAIQRAREEGP